jgi:hypothetical protein
MNKEQKVLWFREYMKHRVLAKRQLYINAPEEVLIDKTYSLACQVYEYLKPEIDDGNYCAWSYSPSEKIIVYIREELENIDLYEMNTKNDIIKGLTKKERILKALELLAQIYAYINIEDKQRIVYIYPVANEFNLVIARTEEFDESEGIASVDLC